MHKIKTIISREILDSRGNPTVEVDMTFDDGSFGRASVPSGASTGTHEAIELHDGNPKRYGGKGVLLAVKNINTVLRKTLEGKKLDQSSLDQSMIDLDGTPNKSKLGANAILGISLAFSHAAAASENIPLYTYFQKISKTEKPIMPIPLMNIINGGKHAEHSTDLQEFMIAPSGAKTFSEALRYGVEIFHALKKILESRQLSTLVGDEGGFAPELPSNEAAIQIIIEAIEKAGYKAGKDVFIAIDAAASELYKNGTYTLSSEKRNLTSAEMVDLYANWIAKYPIVSIEDGLAEDDWQGFVDLTKKVGKKVQIVGDDLFVTNIERLKQGIAKHAGNSILIKLNQIGTVTQTIAAVTLARDAGFTAIISHRSGETEDTSIADFAVGLGCGQIKTGSLSRTDRIAKYNQLLRIEEQLGSNALFPTVTI